MSQKRNSRESVIQQSIEGTCTGITDIVSLSSNEKFRKTVMMILKVKDTVEMKTKLHANLTAIAKQKYGGHSDLWQIANNKIRKTSSFETTSSNGTSSVDQKDEDWSKIGFMLDSDNARMMASEMVRVNEQASSQCRASQSHEGLIEKNCKTTEKKDDDWSKIGLMLDTDYARVTSTKMIPVHEQASSQQRASQSHEGLGEKNSKSSEKADDDWSNIGALLDSEDVRMSFKENQKDQASVLSRDSQKDTLMLETFDKKKDMDRWPVDLNTPVVTDTRNRIEQASTGTFYSVSQNYQYATEKFPKSSKVHLQQKKKIPADTSLSADARGTFETKEKIKAGASLSDDAIGTSGKDKRVDTKVAQEKDVLKTPDLSQIIEGVKNVSPFSQLAFESPPLNHEICHRDSLNYPQQEIKPRNKNGYNSQHLSFSNVTQFPMCGKERNGTLSANDQIVPSMELHTSMKSTSYPYFDKLPKMNTNNIPTYNENSEKPSVTNCFDSLNESPILSKERQNDSNCFDSLNESPIISRASQIQLQKERLARKEDFTSYDGDNIVGPKTASKGRHLAKPEGTGDVVIANNTDEWFDNVLLEVEDWLN